jgi:hypothetical protein
LLFFGLLLVGWVCRHHESALPFTSFLKKKTQYSATVCSAQGQKRTRSEDYIEPQICHGGVQPKEDKEVPTFSAQGASAHCLLSFLFCWRASGRLHATEQKRVRERHRDRDRDRDRNGSDMSESALVLLPLPSPSLSLPLPPSLTPSLPPSLFPSRVFVLGHKI